MTKNDSSMEYKLDPDKQRKAIGILNELRLCLLVRWNNWLLENERQLRSEVTGRDSFTLMLSQIDELFLSKLGILDRALYEINRGDMTAPQAQTTHFEVVEIQGTREELPQKIANLLAEHADKELMQLVPLKIGEDDGEFLAVFSHTTQESAGGDDA